MDKLDGIDDRLQGFRWKRQPSDVEENTPNSRGKLASRWGSNGRFEVGRTSADDLQKVSELLHS